MSMVNLVSGGLDSTLIAVLTQEEGLKQFPLFIDYGQRAATREWQACRCVHEQLGLPEPVRMDLAGYGSIICSGLTKKHLDVKDDAFTPGRNLVFLLMGAAYAHQVGVSAVTIGLLSEVFSLFPDQRSDFLLKSESAISAAFGYQIKIITPLFDFTKADVIELAKEKGITGTYSCHNGAVKPCGKCISCLEVLKTMEV